MRRFLPLLAVVVAALVGWWLLDRGGEPDGLEVPHPPSTSGTTGTTTPDAPSSPPTPEPERESIDVAAIPAAPPSSDSPTGRPIEAGPVEGGVEVHVVSADGEHPVAGAVVTVLVGDHGRDFQFDERERRGVTEARAARDGRRYQADDGGVARIPRPGQGIWIGAEKDGLRGFTGTFWGGDWPVRVHLFPDDVLTVEVRDAAGEPVPDVPVMLGLVRRPAPAPVAIRATGPDGRVDFHHLRARVQAYGTGERFAAALAIPLVEREQVELDPRRPPSEPVVLTLPATGSVRVVVLERDGEPLADDAWIWVGRRLPTRSNPDGRLVHDLAAKLERGRAHFPAVGIGGDLSVTLMGPPHKATYLGTHPAPARHGEEVVLEIDWTDRYPIVAGRLVTPDGSPIPGADVAFGVLAGGVWHGGHPVRCDGEGRFRLAVRADWSPGSNRSANLTWTSPGPTWRGRIDLSHELPAGVTNVGDVVLSPDPLQLSGRVVDAAGRPVEGADIWFATRAEGETEWRTRYGPRVRTDADGRFEFFGTLEGVGRRAWAAADGHADDGPYEFVAGDRDARFVLAPAADGDG